MNRAKIFGDYFQRFANESKTILAPSILAVNRGEREILLKVKLEWGPLEFASAATQNLAFADHLTSRIPQKDSQRCVERLLLPSLEREIGAS